MEAMYFWSHMIDLFAPLSTSVSRLKHSENRVHGTETKDRNGWLSHLLGLGEMLGGAGLWEEQEKQRETKGKQKIDPCSLK